MLPQRHRLKHRRDVQRVRKQGHAWRHPLAILLAAPAEPAVMVAETGTVAAPPARFAFSAGRRVGNAVARNRGKRLLREAVRAQLAHIEPGWDCVLIVRQATPEADYVAVEAAVCSLLRRAQLVREPQLGA